MDAKLTSRAEELARELAAGASSIDDLNALFKGLMKSPPQPVPRLEGAPPPRRKGPPPPDPPPRPPPPPKNPPQRPLAQDRPGRARGDPPRHPARPKRHLR